MVQGTELKSRKLSLFAETIRSELVARDVVASRRVGVATSEAAAATLALLAAAAAEMPLGRLLAAWVPEGRAPCQPHRCDERMRGLYILWMKK